MKQTYFDLKSFCHMIVGIYLLRKALPKEQQDLDTMYAHVFACMHMWEYIISNDYMDGQEGKIR